MHDGGVGEKEQDAEKEQAKEKKGNIMAFFEEQKVR